jgi:MFS family permease
MRCAIAADVLRATALVGMIVVPGTLPLLAFAVLTGIGTTIFRPAVFALLPNAVHEQRRPAAVAAWGAAQDGGMMLGPALAAAALVLGGAPVLLALNAATFACSALLLTRVRLVSKPVREEANGDSLVDSAREGLRFVARDRVLRVLVAGTGGIVLAAGMMNVAEILLARRELHVGGAGFAAMVALFGVGMVAGSVASAHSVTIAQLKLGYIAGLVVLGAGLLGSAISPTLEWAIVAFFVTGFGSAASMTHDRGLVQTLVPPAMLSRAHALNGSIEAWAFAGAAVLGGTLATLMGARGVFAVAGAGVLLVAAIAGRTLLRPEARPHVVPEFSPA